MWPGREAEVGCWRVPWNKWLSSISFLPTTISPLNFCIGPSGEATQKGRRKLGRQRCYCAHHSFFLHPHSKKLEIFLSFATSRLFHISCIRFVVVVFDVYLCSLTFVKSLELHMVKLWNFLRNLQARSNLLRVSTLCVPPTYF